MKFLDLFAGIGGFRLGMERAGHECIGFCEIDKFARKSYKAIHNIDGEVEMHDITKVSGSFIKKIGKVDIICGGFPCQAFSIAGKRRGFEDTRGTLFFEIARFASILQPKILFLENVKGLLNHDRGKTFEIILRTLDELGYNVQWEVCNSKNFVPQNRERIFIVGYLRGESSKQIFPFKRNGGQTDGRGERGIVIAGKLSGNREQSNRIYDIRGIAPTLSTMQGGGQEPKIIETKLLVKEATKKGFAEANVGDEINLSHPDSKTQRGRVQKGISNTLLTNGNLGVVTEEVQIRKLTPCECFRLQGFPDLAFLCAKFGSKELAAEIIEKGIDHYDPGYKQIMSDSQLYKQAGNSVTVDVIYEIAKRL